MAHNQKYKIVEVIERLQRVPQLARRTQNGGGSESTGRVHGDKEYNMDWGCVK